MCQSQSRRLLIFWITRGEGARACHQPGYEYPTTTMPQRHYAGLVPVTAPHASPFHFGKRPPEMKSRKEEHLDECNYETVKKETRNESL